MTALSFGQSDKAIIVVGAGVIGTAVAHELQARGQQVVLIDRDKPGCGASFGNMALIAVTEFMPLSRPSMWRQIPGWLLNPEGPVAIAPSYLPKLLPWFWRFLLASRPSVLNELESAAAVLCQRALGDTQALLKTIDAAHELSETGALALYASEKEWQAGRTHIDMLRRFGFEYEVLDYHAIRVREPELNPAINKGILFPDNRFLQDPYRFVTRLAERFEALGGTILRCEVTGFQRSEKLTGVYLADGRLVQADTVVLCAGAYTAQLADKLGEPIPLETERGYHTQIMDTQTKLNHSIIWPARAFVVTPTAGGLRVGGTVEMAGLDAPPDWRRSKITVKHARMILPELKVAETSEWMGHRPAFPDTLPVMSASAKTQGVYYATGHGHLGLTYAATTARLMGQLIAGESPEVDLTPYRIDRF